MQNSRLHVRLSSFRHEKGDLTDFVSGHPFNSALEVFFPFSHSPCPHYNPRDILGGKDPIFHVVRTSLKGFLAEDFLEKRVRDGSVWFGALQMGGTGYGRRACVTPWGVMRLCLDEEGYERLGLAGARSSQRKGT